MGDLASASVENHDLSGVGIDRVTKSVLHIISVLFNMMIGIKKSDLLIQLVVSASK